MVVDTENNVFVHMISFSYNNSGSSLREQFVSKMVAFTTLDIQRERKYLIDKVFSNPLTT